MISALDEHRMAEREGSASTDYLNRKGLHCCRFPWPNPHQPAAGIRPRAHRGFLQLNVYRSFEYGPEELFTAVSATGAAHQIRLLQAIATNDWTGALPTGLFECIENEVALSLDTSPPGEDMGQTSSESIEVSCCTKPCFLQKHFTT